jgi:hypothetical protein
MEKGRSFIAAFNPNRMGIRKIFWTYYLNAGEIRTHSLTEKHILFLILVKYAYYNKETSFQIMIYISVICFKAKAYHAVLIKIKAFPLMNMQKSSEIVVNILVVNI